MAFFVAKHMCFQAAILSQLVASPLLGPCCHALLPLEVSMVHVDVGMAIDEEYLHGMSPSLFGAIGVITTTHHQRMLMGKLCRLIPHAEQLLKPFPFLIIAHIMSLQIANKPLPVRMRIFHLRGKNLNLFMNRYSCLNRPYLHSDPIRLF